ncbi:MAG: hypothetical protein M5U26_17970 [Planctomycetota bacterium]|nr:hypothetical protein [Planctomycetota bacterium]
MSGKLLTALLERLRLTPRTWIALLTIPPLLLVVLLGLLLSYRLLFPVPPTGRWERHAGPFEDVTATGRDARDLIFLATPDAGWSFTMPGFSERKLTLKHAVDLQGFDKLKIPLKLESGEPGAANVQLRLIHHNGWIYETQAEWLLRAGEAKALEVDLSPRSASFYPIGHGRPWDAEAARAVERVILKARSNRAFQGRIRVGEPIFEQAPPDAGAVAVAKQSGLPALQDLKDGAVQPAPRQESPEAAPLWLPNRLEVLDAEATTAPGEVAVSLRLEPMPPNPFDPALCDLRVLLAPAGADVPRGRDAALPQKLLARARPAYFDQAYLRLEVKHPAEELRPIGLPRFRAEIRIDEARAGTRGLEWVREGQAATAHLILNGRPIGRLPVVLPAPKLAARPGDEALQASQKKLAEAPLPEWTSAGEEAFCGRYASRPAWTGMPWTGEAARYLGRAREVESGEPPAPARPADWSYEPWPEQTVCWCPPLEWNAAWGKWQGLGRYDLELCWRFDRILERAERERLSLPLLLTADDRFFNQGKFRWPMNPLAADAGGPVSGPADFYRTPEARASAKALLRYLEARYGGRTALGAWLFGSTLPARQVPEWHAELAEAAAALAAADGLWGGGAQAAEGEAAFAAARTARPVLSLHPWATPFETVSRRNSFEPGAPEMGRPDRGEKPYWKAEQRLSPGTELTYSQTLASDGRNSVALSNRMPGHVCLVRELLFAKNEADNFYDFHSLVFDAYVPPGAPHDMRAMVHLRDRDELWYETLLDPLLRPGDWTRVVVDLTAANRHKFVPINHQRPWDDYSRTRVREIGIRVFCMRPYTGKIHLDDIHLAGKQAGRVIRPVVPRVAARQPAAAACGRYEKWELDFDLNKSYPNPYDPEVVDVLAAIETPSGKVERVPCFFYEPYERKLVTSPFVDTVMERKETRTVEHEQIVPVAGGMAGYWKLRYAPKELGPHRVRVEVREGGKWTVEGERWIADDRFTPDGEPLPWRFYHGQFTEIVGRRPDGRRRVQNEAFTAGELATRSEPFNFVAEPSNSKGFVRSARDGRYLEFSNGEFYYPIGINVATPSEEQLPYSGGAWDPPEGYYKLRDIGHRGTFQYDDYFAKFKEHGLNWAKVWMATWWMSLEWRRDWPPYQGVGRYSQPNAWRMDHLVERAQECGIYLQIILMNHGQVSTGINHDWENCPYSSDLGGPLKSAREFYSEAEGKKLYKNKLRYIAARWGYATSILDWTLCGEMDFTEEYQTNDFNLRTPSEDKPAPETMVLWINEMARYMRAHDPGDHLISTHISHPQRGQNIQFAKELDYVQSNAYSGFPWIANGGMNAVEALAAYFYGQSGLHHFAGMKQFKKPVLVCEQGGHWHGRSYKYGNWTRNTKDSLDADLHCGLWGGIMTPMAGQTGYWWWIHVHFDDTYRLLDGPIKFMRGEDLRGQDFERGVILLADSAAGLKALSFQNRKRGFAWLYAEQMPFKLTQREFSGVESQVYGLESGSYEIEYWHTRKGEVLKRETLPALLSRLRGDFYLMLKPPAFEGDIAIKFRKVGN